MATATIFEKTMKLSSLRYPNVSHDRETANDDAIMGNGREAVHFV